MLPQVTITQAAASRSLCLKATVETELGITAGSEDAKLNRLIRTASAVVANLLGRDPWLQTYVERRSGDGGVYLYVSRWPILSITSITQGTGSSPSTVDSDDYSVGETRRDRIYRADGWVETEVDEASIIPGSRALEYNVTYQGGWVMPDKVTEWAASTAVSASEWYKATDPDYPLIFQADSDGGTTDSSEPTWPTDVAGTVVDNDITWTAYDQQTPYPVEEAALVMVMDWYDGGLTIPSGIDSETVDSARRVYSQSSAALSRAVRTLLDPYR